MELVMPKLDHTMEEGTISKWYFKVGDIVNKGDIILSVETNKSVLEVESSFSGKLKAIVAQEGDVVPVFGLLAVIE